MHVIGFAGYSGAGKTTLVERLIPVLKRQGQRVSVVKHAHHKFDVDHPGKDSYRHREAGAFEVVVASDRRLALMREFEQPSELSVHHLIAELYDGVDWVLVEGFKHSDLLKIEVLRESGSPKGERPAQYPDDVFIVALATDRPDALPEPTLRPVFDLDDAEGIVQWLLDNAQRFDYKAENHELSFR
ncbi:molybdopterin-guanine dinucleotide biosynthesis protein B [Variovorax boronicumulans]|uniref:molybdopterin-guanine dinucleotide biosynthesis protein B n=1 Tax=Variovorax boronicumulans TaxID=436515 RepID=UPI001C571AB1